MEVRKKLREKIYPNSREIILNAICDMAEMQNWRSLKTNPRAGDAEFIFEFEGRVYEGHFTVMDTYEGCRVRLEMIAEDQMLDRTLFLLESILPKIGKEG
jgi:hypothetical protein